MSTLIICLTVVVVVLIILVFMYLNLTEAFKIQKTKNQIAADHIWEKERHRAKQLQGGKNE